jgi:hypothetical protein
MQIAKCDLINPIYSNKMICFTCIRRTIVIMKSCPVYYGVGSVGSAASGAGVGASPPPLTGSFGVGGAGLLL